jgi:hypothetical protein
MAKVSDTLEIGWREMVQLACRDKQYLGVFSVIDEEKVAFQSSQTVMVGFGQMYFFESSSIV